LQRAPGEFLEVNRDVEVDKTSDAHKFVVFSGPSVSSTVVDVALEPGARVAVSATFTSVEDTLAMTFGKLYPHRGWIVL